MPRHDTRLRLGKEHRECKNCGATGDAIDADPDYDRRTVEYTCTECNATGHRTSRGEMFGLIEAHEP